MLRFVPLDFSPASAILRAMRTARSGHIILPIMLLLLAGMAPGQSIVAPIDQPSYLQVEVLEAGLGAALGCQSARGSLYILPYPYVGARMLKLTYHSGHGLRAGISLFDGEGPPLLDALGLSAGGTYAPVHVGYDIVFRPRKTGFFWSTVPSCYAEATFGAFPLFGRLAAGYDINYWGAGIGVECGATTLLDFDHPSWVVPAIYAALKLRLLDAAFRLPGRR